MFWWVLWVGGQEVGIWIDGWMGSVRRYSVGVYWVRGVEGECDGECDGEERLNGLGGGGV